jgi:hypothetical protein
MAAKVEKSARPTNQTDASLELANCYASLRGKRLPLKGPEWATAEIGKEFDEWVSAKISSLMGSKDAATTAAGFTEEESAALKELAKQIIARKNAPAKQAQAQEEQPAPLRPAINHAKLNQANNKILNAAAALEKMEEEGPTF